MSDSTEEVGPPKGVQGIKQGGHDDTTMATAKALDDEALAV